MTAWKERLTMLGPVVGLALLALVRPDGDGPTFCPFALCTGTACPGCGMTRAASSLVRGEFATAITYHPLIPIVAIEASVAWGWWMLSRRGLVRPIGRRVAVVSLLTTALALLVVWVIRLRSGTLPAV